MLFNLVEREEKNYFKTLGSLDTKTLMGSFRNLTDWA